MLDLCAGVGTKSTQAAEMMNNTGAVVAGDTNADKLALIPANAERLGLTIIRPTPVEKLETVMAELPSPNLILVDAPCLNTGVLARRPEARYRAGQKNLQEVTDLQREILQTAHRFAGPATRIIYTTCSLETEENEQQVEWFCETFPRRKAQRQEFTLPTETQDGGFAALIRS